MRYVIRERILSIGDDFWITDERGTRVFLVDGKALRLTETFELKDSSGAVIATIHKRLLSMRGTLEIEHDGAVIATVRRALISPLRHRSVIDLSDGSQLEAVGNILDKEFEIRGDAGTVAWISRSWFSIRDTYGVDVAPGENDVLILAIAICLDQIHQEEQRHDR